MKSKHIGSDFDDFLREEDLLEDAESIAAKRVIAFQVAQEMKRRSGGSAPCGRRRVDPDFNPG